MRKYIDKINGVMIGCIVNMIVCYFIKNLYLVIFWGFILVALANLKGKDIK
jgi:hypothetical protein